MQICRLVVDQNQAIETRRFAAEGLSYWTLDADVKEWMCADKSLIRALVEVAKVRYLLLKIRI